MRDSGYYWVHLDGVWQPALFNGTTWWTIGCDFSIADKEIRVVGDKIPAYYPTS